MIKLLVAIPVALGIATAFSPQIITLAIPSPVPTPSMLTAMQQHPEDPSAALLGEIIRDRQSLFPPSVAPDLDVVIRDGKIIYTTTANYYTQTPRCAGEDLDFQIAATANFGLRGYIFDSDQCVILEVGEHDTAYYSVAVDHSLGIIAYAIPGQARIDIYELTSHSLMKSVHGYSATTLTFYDGRLYFAGHPTGQAWDQASIFSYSLENDRIEGEFLAQQLADVRGIDFHDELVAVSDGAHHRIVIAGNRDFQPRAIVEGLNYPNGVSYTGAGDLLVADEHNGLVHRITQDGEVIWSSPQFELISPGSVVEISQGRHQGELLIADADGNRVLLVQPDTWEISFEITGLRSTLKAIPIYENDISFPNRPQ